MYVDFLLSWCSQTILQNVIYIDFPDLVEFQSWPPTEPLSLLLKFGEKNPMVETAFGKEVMATI